MMSFGRIMICGPPFTEAWNLYGLQKSVLDGLRPLTRLKPVQRQVGRLYSSQLVGYDYELYSYGGAKQ